MEILALKIVLLFILSFTCLLCGLIPLRIVRFIARREARASLTGGNAGQFHERGKRFISLLSCFGGGVFLATCLLDLLPTVRDKLSLVFDRLQIYTAFPVSEFVVACGFFVVLIVEQTALECKEKSTVQKQRTRELTSTHYDENGQTVDASRPLLDGEGAQGHTSINSAAYGTTDRARNSNNSHIGGQHTSPSVSYSHEGHQDEHDDHSHDFHSHSPLRSLLLLLALSLHSVFEGLAMGLQTDNDQLLAIFSAVIIHKNILAFSLGMNLVQSHMSRLSVLMSCICFASMAPIGITLGIVLIESFSNFTHSIMNGILQGFATGTFLYITFLEVLPHEMLSNKDRLLKVLFLLLGFSTICGLLFLDPTIVRPSCYQGAQPV